jgi:hypothetical protein
MYLEKTLKIIETSQLKTKRESERKGARKKKEKAIYITIAQYTY